MHGSVEVAPLHTTGAVLGDVETEKQSERERERERVFEQRKVAQTHAG